MKQLGTLSLFIVGISFSFVARAQTSGWEAGINLSTGASDYIITNVDDNIFAKEMADNVRDAVRPKLYYSAGVYGRKFFQDMFGVELGVQYSSFAAGPKKGKIYDFGGNLIGTTSSAARHNYIDIPVRFIFKKDIGNFSVGAFAGVAPAILTHSYSRTVTRIDGNKNVDKDNYNSNTQTFNLFIDAGALFRYNITDQFSIDAKPFVRVSPLHAYSDTFVPNFDVLLIAGGLNVGTVWRF